MSLSSLLLPGLPTPSGPSDECSHPKLGTEPYGHPLLPVPSPSVGSVPGIRTVVESSPSFVVPIEPERPRPTLLP